MSLWEGSQLVMLELECGEEGYHMGSRKGERGQGGQRRSLKGAQASMSV